MTGDWPPSSAQPARTWAAMMATWPRRGRSWAGGISTDNGGLAVDAGANLLAVIAGVFDAPDPLAALRTLTSLFPPSPDDEP